MKRQNQPADRVVEVERRIPASPAVVFEYFVNPDRYLEWQGIAAELDPRPGGIYRVTMNDSGFIARGEYLEVTPPRRVVFSFGWEGEHNIPPGTTTVEVDLVADGTDTIVRLRHSGLVDGPSCEIHTYGWNVSLDQLLDASRTPHGS